LKNVTKIELTVPQMPERQKVAAYARVSMESERLQHSLSAQVSYYSEFIQKHTDWQYVGVYADNGISGTGTAKRDEFQHMLDDCEAGKIDIILTKSISRFARNTVDLLRTVRHLKELYISVRFEKENIDSLSEDGELMLTLLGSFAQEESRSISDNVKWGTVKRFQQGIPNGHFPIYGYRWQGDTLVIEPEEAKIVCLIYDNFLKGLSAETTEKQLETMGVKSYKGMHFGNTSIRQILRNITYTGNLLFQKEYTVDPISKKSRINRGELPQYWVENTHEAIIDMETYNAVQAEVARRRELGVFANWTINTTCFTSKIICEVCSRPFHRSTRSRTNGKFKVWVCANRKEGKPHDCMVSDLPEYILERVAAEALGLDEFDADTFAEQIEKIMVPSANVLVFHFYDGRIISKEWESTAKKDWWTPERRRLWGERHKRKDTNPNKNTYYEFTGFIKCGRCGSNYRCQSTTLKDGTKTRSWYCTAPSGTCDKISIKDDTMKALVTDVLGLAEYDEAAMDAQLEYASVLKGAVTFHFRDGHEAMLEFHDKRRGVKWTEERREKQCQAIKDSWTDERRAAMSERVKQIRSEKQWLKQ